MVYTMLRIIQYPKAIFLIFIVVCLGACQNRTHSDSSAKTLGAVFLSPASGTDSSNINAMHRSIEYAVIISVDGLGSLQLQPLIDNRKLPTFAKLQKTSLWTHDARSDVTNTTTMANHTCILTGLPSSPPLKGNYKMHHGYHFNREPPQKGTLHNMGNPALEYIPSVFDQAHDNGLKTCLFSGKSKFVIFDRSYDNNHGRPDTIGKDNGKAKIDIFEIANNTEILTDSFSAQIKSSSPCNLTLFHITELDSAGHAYGWGSEIWNKEVEKIDGLLGKMLDSINNAPRMKNKTAIIITADHGGTGKGHGNTSDINNFAIPFYVLGPNLKKNTDLYQEVQGIRHKPGPTNPPYTHPKQPVRNGDAANLALLLLGLPPIEGSIMYGMKI